MMAKLLLIMRNTYGWNGDHIETLRQMGIEIHLATMVADAQNDPRFASVIPLSPDFGLEESAEYLLGEMARLGLGTAVTFYEADIVLTALVNARLGHDWANPEAEMISRDKRLQREFLAKHAIPSARFSPVDSADPIASGIACAAGFDYPVIVKPTYMSASIGVSLVHDEPGLRAALAEVASLARNWQSYFLADRSLPIALIEEYLPGTEVTLDGVVLYGKFHLAGVTNKMQMPGPHFEEDLYSLPFRNPGEEPELAGYAQAIIDGLGMDHCLFNAEFRADAAGQYRVIEFSTRLSGGHNYRNLRDVYGINVVRLFVKAVLAGTDPATEEQVWADELRRLPPRMATCIKYAYRSGVLIRNNVGDAASSCNFRDYRPLARPGALLRRAPEGWNEFCGSLAVAAPYREPADIDRVERLAEELDARLDIVVV